MEQDEQPGAGGLRQPHRVLDGGVTEVAEGGELRRGVLGVVDQHVDAAGEGHGRPVVGAQPAGALFGGHRAVVRQVGERGPRVGDPVAERPAPLVGDLGGDHVESLDVVVALLLRRDPPAPL